MLLASEVAGALAAGLIALTLARGSGQRGRAAIGSVAVVSIAIATLISLPNLRTAVATFRQQHEETAVLTSEQQKLLAGMRFEVDVEFLAWVKQHLAPDETFHLVVGHLAKEEVTQWGLFQLAPNLGVRSSQGADWIVFYDVVPARYSASSYHDLEVYEPGFAIARPRVAG